MRVLGLAGWLAVLGAALWAAAGGDAVWVGSTVAVGLVLATAGALMWRYAALGTDLAVPGGRRVPAPPWGWVTGPPAAAGAVVAAAAGNAWVAAVAGGLLAVTLAGPLRPGRGDTVPARAARTARRLRAFARQHGVERGEPVSGYLTPVGEFGTRLVVVAPDGGWADVMLGEDAELVAELARIELGERTDQALGQALRTDRPVWTRMIESW